MNTSLTTFDGFPRADIDVAQIRTTRAHIIRLRNDHKAVMAKLEVALHEHFAAGKAAEAAATTDPAPTQTRAPAVQAGGGAPSRAGAAGASSSAAVEPPFARVNTVVPRSPAAQAGLAPGDKVTKFGSVNWTNHERLGKVAQVVQQNENVS